MYSKLDGPNSLFRLLHLLPGQKTENIECKLETLSLDHPKDFEALSYVWGDPTNPLPISLGGQAIKVTRSLHFALRYLRYPDRIRTLWVDAVCINQADVIEKSLQVRLMGRIYSTAKEVIVWLGESKDEDSGVIRLIEAVGNDPNLHWNGLAGSVDRSSLCSFFKNPWWYRIWTAQEAVLAQKLTYQYGDRIIQGNAMNGMLNSFTNHLSSCCIEAMDVISRGASNTELSTIIRLHSTAMNFLHPKHSKTFCQAIIYFRHRTATNPRDKIYGLLGIIDDSEFISVDYGLSSSDAYEKATREILISTGKLDIFSHLIRSPIASRRSRVGYLPSWVPDWDYEFNTFHHASVNTDIRIRILDMFNACGSHDYDPLQGDVPGSLRLGGFVFDEVVTISSSIYTNLSLFAGEVLRDWRTMAQIETIPDNPYPTGETVLEAFWRTLSLDISCSRISCSDTGTPFKRAESNDRSIHDTFWFIALLNMHSIPLSNTLPETFQNQLAGNLFNQHLDQTIYERRFFLTRMGYMGLGPDGLLEGDKVCVLAGGRLPLILRGTKPNSNRTINTETENIFQILGDAYLHGIMDGEAMKMVDEGKKTFRIFELR